MEINGVNIQDTFAEGFGIKVSRLIITAATKHLADLLLQLSDVLQKQVLTNMFLQLNLQMEDQVMQS